MRTTIRAVAVAALIVAAAGCGPNELTPSQEALMARTIELEDGTIDLEPVYQDDFTDGADDWLAEGTPRVEAVDGRLSIDAVRGEPHAATVWCKHKFEGDQVVEYTCRVEPTLDSRGRGETNMNFFLFASDPDGPDLLETSDQRSGTYSEYHELRNYIFTYLSVDRQGRAPIHGEHGPLLTRVRFRKDPGFGLLEERWLDEPVVKGRDYRFTMVIQGPRMRFYVDGRKLIDYRDTDAPWREGYHGFRTWMSHTSSDGFTVSRIAADHTGR